MGIVTTTDVAPAIAEWYDRNLLENARSNLVHDQFSQVRPLPQKSSTVIKFRRANTFSTATTPLTEGVTPTGSSFGYTEVKAAVKPYGDFVTYSDKVDLVNQDSVITDITTEQGFQSGETIDELRRDTFVTGTSVQYANGSARASINTVPTQGDFETIIRELRNQKGRYIKERLNAGRDISTEPISPAFFAIVHPDLITTIEGMTDFINVRKYARPREQMINEVGSLKEIRFVWTDKAKVWLGGGATGGTNVKETSSNADVYATLIFAANATGIVPLSGKSMETIVKAIGSSGSNDPLNQRGSVAWKAYTTQVILNENWMYRLESAATDAIA